MLCNEQGDMSFYNQKGVLQKSFFVPHFPQKIQF